MCIYIYMYVCVYVCVYIYIYVYNSFAGCWQARSRFQSSAPPECIPGGHVGTTPRQILLRRLWRRRSSPSLRRFCAEVREIPGECTYI